VYFAVLDDRVLSTDLDGDREQEPNANANKRVWSGPRARWRRGEKRRGSCTILLGVADEDVVQYDVAADVETQDSLSGVEKVR
jgi:hypothetical protein